MRSSNFLRQAKRRQNRAPQVPPPIDYSPGDRVVGKDTLAELLEVSVTSIERWIRDGLPVVQRGDELHDWIFELEPVRSWLRQKDESSE